MKSIKNFFKKLLKNIEDQNKESFGKGNLDCCELNKSKKRSKNKDKL